MKLFDQAILKFVFYRQRYAISRRAQNIIDIKLNFAYAFILDCSQLSQPIIFEILRKMYELTGPQAVFEYWWSGLLIDNLSKLID